MCKFCESYNKAIGLLYTDNENHQERDCNNNKIGVSVSSSLFIRGNRLYLQSRGCYTTSADYYYEREGLECDRELAEVAPPSSLKIKFCPFCGKDLQTSAFNRKLHAHNIMSRIESELEKLENVESNLHCCMHVEIQTVPDKYIFRDDKDKEVIDAKEKGTKLWKEYSPLTIKNLFEKDTKYPRKTLIIFTPNLNRLDYNCVCRYGKDYKYPLVNITRTPIQRVERPHGMTKQDAVLLKSCKYEVTPKVLRQIIKLGYETTCISDEYVDEWEKKIEEVNLRLAILRGRKQKLEQYIKEL